MNPHYYIVTPSLSLAYSWLRYRAIPSNRVHICTNPEQVEGLITDSEHKLVILDHGNLSADMKEAVARTSQRTEDV